jgi:hypothetical protein
MELFSSFVEICSLLYGIFFTFCAAMAPEEILSSMEIFRAVTG